MKTYLEIKVPIQYSDSWFVELRSRMGNIPIKWQKEHYHITVVFIDDTINIDAVLKVVEYHMNSFVAPLITFDKIDTFVTTAGNMYIINLTTDTVPASFVESISKMRNELIEQGHKIESNFRLHVTLGRVQNMSIPLSEIQRIINQYNMEPLSKCMQDANFRIFRGETLKKWILTKQL